MTDRIEAALAALDKATPGPWGKPYWDNFPGDRGWWIHNGLEGANEYAVAVTFERNPKDEFDATLIAAAPDMAEKIKEQESEIIRLRKWQSEAVGYLRADFKSTVDEVEEYPELAKFNPQWKEMIDDLDRLIAEAEGEKNAN